MKKKVLVVDPASGWKYGFPCEWDQEKETMKELFTRMKYPEKLWDYPVRFWEAEVEVEDES